LANSRDEQEGTRTAKKGKTKAPKDVHVRLTKKIYEYL
jgi:hypothetical protein